MALVHMAGILLFALAVALGGLFMLAYSKKENLGKFYSIGSLVAVIFASCVFIFGLACGIMCMACGKGHCGSDGDMKHHRMMMMHKMHGECGQHGMMMGRCDKMQGECEGMSHCKMKGKQRCEMMSGCRDNTKCEGGGMKKEIIIEVEDKDGKKTETKTEVK